jgi:3',5'-cyclic AMP phosphodiesterase CpdA
MPITDSSPRLAVISDIHGNLRALEAVLTDIETRGADAIVNLGDCATSPLWPRETLDLLESLSFITVRGITIVCWPKVDGTICGRSTGLHMRH